MDEYVSFNYVSVFPTDDMTAKKRAIYIKELNNTFSKYFRDPDEKQVWALESPSVPQGRFVVFTIINKKLSIGDIYAFGGTVNGLLTLGIVDYLKIK